jgi:cation transport protein ChaC
VSACLAEGIRCPHLMTLQAMVAQRLQARVAAGIPVPPGA